ncbi:Uncharacterized protein APZ42_025138 [Daphnia magna]|uniref:Uncharacterized protein n=1 Tax=Daphnia magna TaxID=35525 RepID=A0A162DDS8_9CRUS|nr:Uncharacterized protein APZ42_025138 [Daphnia magna]
MTAARFRLQSGNELRLQQLPHRSTNSLLNVFLDGCNARNHLRAKLSNLKTESEELMKLIEEQSGVELTATHRSTGTFPWQTEGYENSYHQRRFCSSGQMDAMGKIQGKDSPNRKGLC